MIVQIMTVTVYMLHGHNTLHGRFISSYLLVRFFLFKYGSRSPSLLHTSILVVKTHIKAKIFMTRKIIGVWVWIYLRDFHLFMLVTV